MFLTQAGLVCCSLSFGEGQGEVQTLPRQQKHKACAFAGTAFRPDFTPMVGDNLAAQCQTNTRSAVCFLMVQALENTKDLFRGSGMNPYA